MNISVVICTHNRAESLQQTLQSLGTQTLSTNEFEILVVDNGSTDQTKTVTQSFTQLPVRYMFEPQLGLSVARNTGWQAAKTDFVVFLDDDAQATPAWLENILDTFSNHGTHAVAVGGRVEAVLPKTKPAWLAESLLFCLGELRLTAGVSDLTDTAQYLPGCNLAFSKKTLTEHDGFTTLLGRKGQRLLSGEEILLQKKLQAAGGTILYNDKALVKHHVPANRLTKRWFLQRMYWEGVSVKRMARILGQESSVGTEIIHLLRQVFSIQFIFRGRFSDICTAAKRVGSIRESIWSH